MEIQAFKVKYAVLGKEHVVYTPQNDGFDELLAAHLIESEIKKIHSTAVVISASPARISKSDYDLNSFEMLVKRNEELEARFSHIDKEALQ